MTAEPASPLPPVPPPRRFVSAERDVIDGLDGSQLGAYRVAAERPERFDPVLYDTFDWRLYRAGGMLMVTPRAEEHEWCWTDLDGRLIERRLHPAAPGLADSLPGGVFTELAAAVSIRRLLPLAEMSRQRSLLRVLDDARKTVARLWVENDTVRPIGTAAETTATALDPVLRLVPVRGYDTAFAAVAGALDERPEVAPLEIDEPTRLATAVGRRPGDYSSKLALELEPAATAGEATKAILLSLLDTIERNEDGTRRDLDSEFLHDFRVAVRRTRSALSQIKGVLPPADLERFRHELSWLGKLTGPTRDLDVYLLKIDDYETSLGEAVASDLEPLRHFLVRRQRAEQRRLAKALEGERYRRLLADWREFLDSGPWDAGEGTPNARRPVREVASERIWKVYRRIVKRGRKAVEHHSPPGELHALRILCKKLRYLLEFFRSLYGTEVERSIKSLKKLQDNLGDFNDYEVQQETLQTLAEGMFEQGEAPAATFLAMGRLQARLEAGQGEERRRFAQRFAKFSAAGSQQRFAELFGR